MSRSKGWRPATSHSREFARLTNDLMPFASDIIALSHIIFSAGSPKSLFEQFIMQRTFSLIASAMLLSACASTQIASLDNVAEPIAKTPYRLDYQGWITVQASVNGIGPYDFIADSGATITTVFANLAAEQNFEPADQGPIRIIGLSGAKNLPAYEIGDVKIGDASLEDHVGVILPDWRPPYKPPQGVLGLDFFSRYTTHFDARNKIISLYGPGADFSKLGRGWAKADLEPLPVAGSGTAKPLYRVYLRINDARIPCIVDLGASGTLFNFAAYYRMASGVIINGDRRSGFSTGTRIRDVFDNRDRAQVVGINRVRMGTAAWTNKLYLVYDAQIFDELGVADKPFCLVGADLLANRSFIFDFANETLYIGPEAKG